MRKFLSLALLIPLMLLNTAWTSESGGGVVSSQSTIVRTSLEATQVLQSDLLTLLYGETRAGGTVNYSSIDSGGIISLQNIASSRDVVELKTDQMLSWYDATTNRYFHFGVSADNNLVFASGDSIRWNLLDQNSGVYTPQMFGAKGDGVTDDTAAFQKAIDAAEAAVSSMDNIRGGTVEVPYTNAGYVISSIHVPTGVSLVGRGGMVYIQQNSTDGSHMIEFDAANDVGTITSHNQSLIENFTLEGSLDGGGTGDVLHYLDFQDATIRRVNIYKAGGWGIYGAYSATSVNNGLKIYDAVVTQCQSGGIKADTNASYWLISDVRATSNTAYNMYLKGNGHTIIGGVINAPDSGVGLALVNTSGAAITGTMFEATSLVATAPATLIQLGDFAVSGARGTVINGGVFTASGSTQNLTFLDVEHAQETTIIGGMWDANVASNVTAIDVSANSTNTLILNPRMTDNLGAGNWVDISGTMTTVNIFRSDKASIDTVYSSTLVRTSGDVLITKASADTLSVPTTFRTSGDNFAVKASIDTLSVATRLRVSGETNIYQLSGDTGYTLGLGVKYADNTSCRTTCSAGQVAFGWDAGQSRLVSSDDALADACVCTG